MKPAFSAVSAMRRNFPVDASAIEHRRRVDGKPLRGGRESLAMARVTDRGQILRDRRAATRGGWRFGALLLALGTASCQHVPAGLPRMPAQMPAQVRAVTPVAADAADVQGEKLGSGPVRVALLLPMTASGAVGKAAAAMRNAAQLAIDDSPKTIEVVVKDTAGVPTVATDAAGEAFNEGAAMALGPLFAANVSAVSGVLSPRHRIITAFSSDSSVAAPGVYLQSFLPEAAMARTIAYAMSHGVRRIAAFLPEDASGNIAERVLRQTLEQQGGELTGVVRYAAGDAAIAQAATAFAAMAQTADGLFVPEGPKAALELLKAADAAQMPLKGKQLLGSGQWSTGDLSDPGLAGAWFADADHGRLDQFRSRYKARFGDDPPLVAVLSYDAVALAASLAETGASGITTNAIERPEGWNGYGGVFRFHPGGRIDRAYAVYEVRNGRAVTISPAGFGEGS